MSKFKIVIEPVAVSFLLGRHVREFLGPASFPFPYMLLRYVIHREAFSLSGKASTRIATIRLAVVLVSRWASFSRRFSRSTGILMCNTVVLSMLTVDHNCRVCVYFCVWAAPCELIASPGHIAASCVRKLCGNVGRWQPIPAHFGCYVMRAK